MRVSNSNRRPESGSHCGLAPLGIAIAEAADGHPDDALKGLAEIEANDSGFLQSSLYLFRDALSTDQAKSLADLARERQSAGDLSIDLGSTVEQAFLSAHRPQQKLMRRDRLKRREGRCRRRLKRFMRQGNMAPAIIS